MELGEILQPEIDAICAYLREQTTALESSDMSPEVASLLTRARVLLETGEDNLNLPPADDGKAVLAQLTAKFNSISDVLRSVNATSKGLLMLTNRVRRVNAVLHGKE
jgi:hypothetical protein